VAEALSATQVKVLVAVADVAALVKKNSAIDAHARQNTTSIYTAGRIFPMLPEKLSTDLTSLNYHEDRPAIIIETLIGDGGAMQSSNIYLARVHNQAKLAYNSVAAWLKDKAPISFSPRLKAGCSMGFRASMWATGSGCNLSARM
jgi:exoribonuclease-2